MFVLNLALALKGVDYEYRSVNLIADGGEHHKENYKKLNPVEQVPSFVVGDETLIESLPIIEYIDEVYPGHPILPKDPILKAKSRQIAESIASGIQPLQNLNVLQKIGAAGSNDLGDASEWARYWIDRKFAALEILLKSTAGHCCVGNDITLADLCLVPQVFNANRMGVDMKKFPLISTINDYLLQQDAFQVSHPNCQPDCPP